jgi:phosphoserine phosphatase
MAMERAVLFVDIDGTLVAGGSSVYLSEHLGHSETLIPACEAYSAGRIDNDAVATIDARGFAGRSEDQVRAWLGQMPLVAGIEELVSWCQSAGVIPVLASLAWDCVGGHLSERYGFADVCGGQLEVNAGTYTGVVASYFDEFHKLDFARSIARRFGFEMNACAAVGDSRSDLPLFEAVNFAVAFNASPAVRQAANAVLDGQDIAAIVPALEEWLS